MTPSCKKTLARIAKSKNGLHATSFLFGDTQRARDVQVLQKMGAVRIECRFSKAGTPRYWVLMTSHGRKLLRGEPV